MTATLILSHLGCIALGVLLTIIYQQSVKRAVDKATAELKRQYTLLYDTNDQMRGENFHLRRTIDTRKAYVDGIAEGERRQKHKSSVEEFADTLYKDGRAAVKTVGRR